MVQLDVVGPDAPQAGQDLGEGGDDQVFAVSGKNKTKLLDQSVFDISSFHRACGNEILFLFCLPTNTLSDSVRFGQGSVTRFGKFHHFG